MKSETYSNGFPPGQLHMTDKTEAKRKEAGSEQLAQESAASAPVVLGIDPDIVEDKDEDVATGRGGGRRKRKGGRKGGRPTPAPIAVQPIARPARMKRRHWGLVASFLFLVLAPLAAFSFYLATYATDQYVSTTGFTVRTQETSGANDLLGGLAQFTGKSAASDSDILYEFIQSQEIADVVDERLDLRAHYTRPWPRDWMFALWPDATREDLLWYWQRIVKISYDSGAGLTEVQVRAFSPEMAQKVAAEIVRVSQERINALNAQIRQDALKYAQADLDSAVARLKQAREALTQFRSRTGIVDPAADIQGRLGVMNNLQQQLAAALIEYDLLEQTTQPNDPRLTKARQRIDVIRDRIVTERQTFSSDSTETGGLSEDYPSLISEFESLSVDLKYAEEAYRAALTALQTARDEASRQSRYLATYIRPTLPGDSEFPQRWLLIGVAALLLVLVWSILALVYYSLRDRS